RNSRLGVRYRLRHPARRPRHVQSEQLRDLRRPRVPRPRPPSAFRPRAGCARPRGLAAESPRNRRGSSLYKAIPPYVRGSTRSTLRGFMFRTWLSLSRLAVESQQVIWLRTLKLMAGGPAAKRESLRMMTEKVEAAQHAAGSLMLGATPHSVTRHYRAKV